MNGLEISEIQVIPVKPKEGLVAFASCIINKALYIGNIAIYTSPSTQEGFRLAYPIKILPNGKEIHCVHPINKEAGEAILKEIIKNFRDVISNATR